MELESTGGRRLRMGALVARYRTAPGAAPRKELIAAAREACQALKLRPTVRLVLLELAGCYGEQELASGLMVWPSNDYLCRKTGLAERTIRMAIADLQRHALIEPIDSCNRKRYAVRDRSGKVIDAFGFNLGSIWARRLDFTGEIMRQNLEQKTRDRLFDRITAQRNASVEALRALVGIGYRSDDLGYCFETLAKNQPRRAPGVSIDILELTLNNWEAFRELVEGLFLDHSKTETAGSGGAGRRHKEQDQDQSSDPWQESIDKEPGLIATTAGGPLTFGLLLEACPAALLYEPNIRTDVDLVLAGVMLRSTIGAHPDAWDEALRAVGKVAAAILVLYTLQLHEDDLRSGLFKIKNPGGLFRSLVRKVQTNEMDLVVELQALRRRHMT
jgi:replication initiation protein RepC